MGSRFVLTASLADLSDGDEKFATFVRPFFLLEAKWAISVKAVAFSRRDPLYDGGEEIERLRHRAQWGDFEVFRGVRRRPRSAVRLHAAYRVREELVGSRSRDFGIAEVGISAVKHRFVQLAHVNRFEGLEDFNLWAESYGTFGISMPAFGGQDDRVLFVSAGHSHGFSFSPSHFLIGTIGATARHEQGRWFNALGEARLRYLRQHAVRHTLLGKIDYRHGHSLDPEVQILLGTGTGLRGYPVRQFAGTRSLLISAEERWFVADDIGQLLSLGVAAFVDSGFAWPNGTGIDLSDLTTAVGASLLLGSHRLSTRPGVRFDVAYALDPVANASRWVFNAGSDIKF